jgi:hypothetical protein
MDRWIDRLMAVEPIDQRRWRGAEELYVRWHISLGMQMNGWDVTHWTVQSMRQALANALVDREYLFSLLDIQLIVLLCIQHQRAQWSMMDVRESSEHATSTTAALCDIPTPLYAILTNRELGASLRGLRGVVVLCARSTCGCEAVGTTCVDCTGIETDVVTQDAVSSVGLATNGAGVSIVVVEAAVVVVAAAAAVAVVSIELAVDAGSDVVVVVVEIDSVDEPRLPCKLPCDEPMELDEVLGLGDRGMSNE